jgi:NTP pyrophosphatase (non-canonical NTP hydrolase)
MKTLYLDIETIPTQVGSYREDIAKRFLDHHQPRHDALLVESKAVKAPANMTKAETIAAWERDQKPGKIAALEAEAKGELAQAAAKTEEEWRRTSFDGALGQVVVIGFAFDERMPETIFEKDPKKVLSLDAENRALREFFQALELVDEQSRHLLQVVGHNVVDFDLRFLCKVLGIEGKGSEIGDEIDGSKVWDFVQAGRIAEVATYCGGDVHRAREMHRRMAFVQRAAA